ncbi:hypothetical protein HPC49_46130 [Pyxidicoccus fallax]|uniref:Outer membrane protein beta-barrel domain-containing protein n=1 Tax=Pyxidicoccus fallax TaxID=394095 RepID=A0A848LY20_9BACT|nr:hypothetical protein [Pyxidicoccus fallax]NMO22519.1 hypothetical protein [Pyxidicoccus fallax]NPC85557.1 hypothetical protein [Pyxidicoccus fallax]
MHRLRAVLAALTLGAPFAASAADITRIASSFEDDDPFDLFIDVGFERTQTRAKIVREQLTFGGSDSAERPLAPGLWYKGVDARLNLGLAFGLYRDLEFSFKLPLVFQQNERWDVTSDGSASVVNTCVDASGTLLPECAGGSTVGVPLFGLPQESFRGGLGNLHFGLAYAFFKQEKDPSKPTWIVGLDYEAPTAKQRDPSVDTTDPDNRGNIGDRVHKYQIYTAFSRRIGVAEPYFRAHYTIPVRGPGIYSNCDQAATNPGNLGAPENCGTGPWTRKELGIKAPSQLGILFGLELVPFERPQKSQKFALDLRGIGNHVGKGRYYNELSSALRKLLTSEDYFQVGGMLGVTASAAESFTIRASGTFLYNTDHTLTAEDLGQDIDGNGSVDVETNPSELNPTFDWRYDLVSRRFRAVESTTFRFDLSATFSF